MKEYSVRDLFESHCDAITPVDKMYYKQELLKHAESGCKEARYYIDMISK